MHRFKVRPTAPCFSLAALLGAVALASCDSRELTAPPERGARPRGSLAAPQSLGSGFVSGPLDTSPGQVSGITSTDLTTFPESTWVVVSVSGQFALTWNAGSCAERQATAPNWPCQDGSPTVDFAGTPWDGGPVTLRQRYDNGGGGTVLLRGSGGAGGSSGSAVGLFFAQRPGTLSGRANVNAVWAWDPFDGKGPYSWSISGGYTVTATAVPAPFQVTEGAADADGVVTYSAEALYGLQFSNPAEWWWTWPAGAATWTFFPGDSLGDKPDLSGAGWEISGCNFQLVCRYKAPGPGRVQVRAYVEGRFADVRSNPATLPCTTSGGSVDAAVRGNRLASQTACQQPKIVLECDSTSLTRGSTVSCTVRPEPASGTLRLSEWRYESQGATVRMREDLLASARSWSGIMVVSGQMTVTGTVNGQAVPPASSEITVQPRLWAGLLHYPDTVVIQSTTDPKLPYPPITRANTEVEDGAFGLFLDPGFSFFTGSGSGPNEGWRFIRALPVWRDKAEVHINAVLDPHDPFWRRQVGPPPGTSFNRTPPCGPTFMRYAQRLAPAHEAEHYNRARTWWESPEAAALVEALRKYQPNLNKAVMDSTDLTPAYAPLAARQADWDAHSKLRVDCVLQP